MTAKKKKTKRKRANPKPVFIDQLCASADDELWKLAAEETKPEARWNRPRKQSISLRVDREVVDWFKSTGRGYQTRINRILREVMNEGKKRAED